MPNQTRILAIDDEQITRDAAVESIAPAIGEWFHLPEGQIYYHRGHSWVMPESGNVVKVGINDFARKLVGKIDAIKFPGIGSQVRQGEKAWRLMVGSKTIDMLSPVDGKILDINESLLRSPEIIGKDPYGQSWLMKVQAPRISANLKNLVSGGLARRWMEEVRESLLARVNYNLKGRLALFKIPGIRGDLLARMNYSLGALSQDGGVPVDGIARNIDQEKWDEIAKDFFLVS